MASYSSLIKKSRCYLFDKEAILECWNAAQQFLGKRPDLSIMLTDNSSIQGANPQEILDDIYLKSKLINDVKIEGAQTDTNPTKALTLAITSKAVELRVSGTKDDCVRVRAALEDLIDGQVQSFSWVRELWDSKVLLFVKGVLLLVLYLLLLTLQTEFTPFANQQLQGLWVSLAGVEILAIAWLATYSIKRMYPRLTVEIGKSAELGQTAAEWRDRTFQFFVIGVIGAVVGGLIVAWLKLA